MNSLISRDAELMERLAVLERERATVLSKNSHKLIAAISDAATISLRAWEAGECARIVVGIAGFPGSGKTTMAKRIVLAVDDRLGLGHGAHLPMDGFHFRNATLESKGMDSYKGDISTYDVDALSSKLLEVQRATHSTVYAPDYIRARHEVSENAIEVARNVQIVCLEGIYVGYTEGRWSEVRSLIDLLLYLDVPPDICAERIISRNVAAHRDAATIRRKLVNDLDFMTRTMTIVQDADYIVRSDNS